MRFSWSSADYASLAVTFGEGGTLTTTRTEDDGRNRVVGKTLVIRRKDGVTVSASFLLEGDELIVDAMPRFRGVLRRV